MGSFLGAVIGDAKGWPQEVNGNNIEKPLSENVLGFLNWTRKNGGKSFLHKETIESGEYSDDTQLLISSTRSLLYGENWSKYFGKVELPAWLLYERGGGGATKRAAKSLSKGNLPWKLDKNNNKEVKSYFEAGGNGVVMRIMPHVFYSLIHDKNYRPQILINGIYTHGHPRALLGALIYAEAINYLANKQSPLEYGELIDYLLEARDKWEQMPEVNNISDWINHAEEVYKGKYRDIWKQTVQELMDLLNLAKKALKLGVLDDSYSVLKDMGCFDRKVQGAGTVSAVVSIYLASKYASNPELGIMESAYLENADSDTIASLVGGLLGVINELDWINKDWLKIQDLDYITNLVNLLFEESENENRNFDIKLWTEEHNKVVKNKIRDLPVNAKFSFGPFNLRLVNRKTLESSVDKLEVIQFKCISEQGQTIYLKTMKKYKKQYAAKSGMNSSGTVEKNIQSSSKSLGDMFLDLAKMFPGRLVAKRALSILGETMKWIDEQGSSVITEKEIQSFSAKLVQKGISLNEVIQIVTFVVKNSVKNK